jgi:8-amino-7-oxononanoate synthase/dethiobiotin synthase
LVSSVSRETLERVVLISPFPIPAKAHPFHVEHPRLKGVDTEVLPPPHCFPVLPSLASQIAADLEALRARHRLRSCLCTTGLSRIDVSVDGHRMISFASNDYLGLACNPALLRAASEAFARSGFGAGASRLMSGTLPEHIMLEACLASLVHAEAALLFPSGYMANLGAVTALAGPGDLIVVDRAVHASLVDACRLSRAKLAFFPHRDLGRAESHLRRHGPAARRRLLVTESLFSMDGDIAPLSQLASLAQANDAVFVVDEAHAIGSLGPHGAGLCAHLGVEPDVLVGTLGKAIGVSGAFVAGTHVLRSYLLNFARSFLFTTALPPPVAASAQAAVDIVASPEGDRLRQALSEATTTLRVALGLGCDRVPSPIVPLIVGSDEAAVIAASRLREKGFLVPAIRPPTVREGTARLRISLSAKHSPEQIASLANCLLDLPSLHTRTPAVRAYDPAASPVSAASAESSSTLEAPNDLPPRQERIPECEGPREASTGRAGRAGSELLKGAGVADQVLPVSQPNALCPSTGKNAAGIVLLGTDTAVGKTTVAVALLQLLLRHGHRPVPFKPAETGAKDLPSDAIRLRDAANRPELELRLVCPFSFPDPVAPAAAAASAGVHLTLPALLAAAASARTYGTPLVVETAGGILTPYGDGLTSCDLAQALGLPILLVARNALGTVSHTSLALAEIHRRCLPMLGTILVSTQIAISPDQQSNADLIARLTGRPVLGVLPYLHPATPTLLADAFQSSIDLRPILGALPQLDD